MQHTESAFLWVIMRMLLMEIYSRTAVVIEWFIIITTISITIIVVAIIEATSTTYPPSKT